VACQPEQLVDHSDEPTSLKTGNMAKLFERISEILTNEMLENALALACQLNEVIKLRDQVALQARGESARFEQIVLTTIRPARASQVDVDVLKFKTKDVVGMLEAGYESARMALEDRPAETISSEAPPAWSAESVPVI
jgi:hypothetical protein